MQFGRSFDAVINKVYLPTKVINKYLLMLVNPVSKFGLVNPKI